VKILRKSALVFLFILVSSLSMNVVAQDDAAKEGGSIVVTFEDDVSTLDPAIGYDWQNWSMIKSLFEGLMYYKPGTVELAPNLAKSYEVSDDGKTYTFQLRSGVKFHNGREVEAGDFKYSINRVVDPATKSPGAGFFSNVVGYDAVRNGDADELEGITTPDSKTVKIELQEPDATMLHVLAINFSYVVPKEAIDKYGGDFGKNPVGTGPFKMASWEYGRELVFKKNSDYWREGVPHLDKVIFDLGNDPTVSVKRLEQGEVDITGDGIPSAQYLQVKNNPNMEDNLVEGDDMQTSYLTLNTTHEPLDNVDVRKAINLAVNKKRIIQIMNGRAVPAYEILPATMPGYDVSEGEDVYDPDQAKELLKEAGYDPDTTLELFVYNKDPHRRIAQSIQHDLAAIGMNVEIKAHSQATVIGNAGSSKGVDMVWSGGMGWIADYPDPANFYWPILGCDATASGGWNWAKYCNEDIDQRAHKADAMADPSKQDERVELWGQIFADIMDDYPWVPVFHKKRITLKSDRMAGDDKYYVGLISLPADYAHIWVK